MRKEDIELEKKFDTYFKEKGFDGMISISAYNNIVTIDIEYGDWKHEHLFSCRLMEEAGWVMLSETIYGEDDGDCYSACRKYRPTDNPKII